MLFRSIVYIIDKLITFSIIISFSNILLVTMLFKQESFANDWKAPYIYIYMTVFFFFFFGEINTYTYKREREKEVLTQKHVTNFIQKPW